MSAEKSSTYEEEPQESAPQPQQPTKDVPAEQPVVTASASPPGYTHAQPGYVPSQPIPGQQGVYSSPLMGAALAQQQAMAANLPPAQVRM